MDGSTNLKKRIDIEHQKMNLHPQSHRLLSTKDLQRVSGEPKGKKKSGERFRAM